VTSQQKAVAAPVEAGGEDRETVHAGRRQKKESSEFPDGPFTEAGHSRYRIQPDELTSAVRMITTAVETKILRVHES
jgi:hypothetical protein